ncbi:MAG: PASTA domain-containing protein [Sedimentisphaerales bacterium]|nr:PASTA domain-containing protein [Sedimentisphaerales bacterium]
MKRWITVAVLVVGTCPVMHAQPVHFADPWLQIAVEAELQVTNPTVADMARLKRLHLPQSSISDLHGLEYATSMTYLLITDGQITELQPLSSIWDLQELVLDAQKISNLVPLSSITELRLLSLCDNQISYLAPLSPLAKLLELALHDNEISDLSWLAGLTNLEGLYLAFNQISDVSHLAGLTNLVHLELRHNQIRDISPLVGLINLELLSLRGNPLNSDAYTIYIPQIQANGTLVDYDPRVTVPDVVGMSHAAAEQTLQDEGFVVWIMIGPSETVPADYVMSQNPVAGTQVPAGSDVTVTVSTGPSQEPGPTPGPSLPTSVAHWALDETTGLTAADSSGAHDGHLHGDPIWLPDGGIIDGALQFDGIDDYVNCGTFHPSAATGKLTICLWARWNGPNGRAQGLISKRDFWQQNQMMWQLDAAVGSGMVGFRSYGGGPLNAFVLPVGEWVHVAATYDGMTAMVYEDGQQMVSAPMTLGTGTAASLVLAAHQKGGGDCFNGILDDVWLYDQALSEQQIQVVMGGAGKIPWIRAAYWDTRYPTSWVQGSSVRDVLAATGYEILNADQLGQWMEARVIDGKPSVVVFCQDIAPDTVYEAVSPTCTLRKYLDAGGKIVWYGDIPLYYQGHSDGTRTDFGTGGSAGVLGFNAAGGDWDSGEQVTLTDDGRAWGLTQTWSSGRPAQSQGLLVLATDSAGQAAGWVKHFVPGDVDRGFVRLSDCGAVPDFQDVQRLAEYPNSLAPIDLGPEGLLAHWKLDGDATDSAGANHGIVHGNPVWTTGKVDGALRLDGVGDYVDCVNKAALSLTDQMTVAAWVNIAAVHPDWKSIIAKGDSAWRLSTLPGQRKFHFGVGGPPDYPDVDGVREVSLGQWHHVVGTYDGSTIRLYVDGVLDATLPYTGGIDANTQPVFIGENSEMRGRTWQGLIDDVRVYNRVLYADEVAALAAP